MNSDFIILTSISFNKSVGRLARKYPSLIKDLLHFKEELLANPTNGIALGKDCYKIRMKISSKGQGKSGGARVITYVKINNKTITLLEIFDKSEIENITDKELSDLLKKAI